MSSTWINPTIVAKEALRQLKNNTVMGELVYRGYEEEWKKQPNGYKVGQSITLKAPLYLRVKDSAVMDAVDIVERSTTLTLSYRKHVAVAVTSDEMTYNADKMIPRVAAAAGQALGEYIDSSLLGLYAGIPNQVGTPGVTPKDFLTLALANAKLSQHAAPTTDRRCVLDPMAQAYIADNLKNLYNPPMVGPAVERAKFSSLAGMDTFVSQNVNMHTCGSAAGLGTTLVDGTNTEGSVGITVDIGGGAWSTDIHKGDIFTVSSVYGVNPITGVSTGALRQFVAEAATAGAGATEYLVSTTPGVAPYKIYSASADEEYLPYQTVDALPQNDATVTIAGSAGLVHPVNLAFHKDCLGLAMVPLEVPASVSWSAQENYEGYSIRVVRFYDGTNDQEYVRFDVLFGLKVLNPFLGCRIAG